MKTVLFVDDEPKVLQALQRQLHSLRSEWKMHFVDSGVKALDFLAITPVDVIVTDMMMPGMDGAELLVRVMQSYPDTIRIVHSGHASREAVLRLVGPAHQYMSKPSDRDELRDAINRACALRDLLSNEQLKHMVTCTCSLPSIPAIHHELTDELLKEEPSMQRVGEIISQDIGIASKILQLVNSAFFGLRQPVVSVHDAVTYLGLSTVRALALSVHLFDHFQRKKIKGFSIEALADHSLRVAVYARRISAAEKCDIRMGDLCFLAGLLHDIGRLILASGLPDKYAEVLEAARQNARSVVEAEFAEFGSTHAEAGGYLLGLWGLPTFVTEAVVFHHRPADAIIRGFSPVVAVHAADVFTHDQIGTHHDWPGSQVDAACLARAGLTDHLETWRTACLRAET